MSVRIGRSRRWDLGVFCCWAEIVFCKMRGQRSLSGQHYHRTPAATTQNIWYGVSAAMAQCRRRRPGPGPAQLSRTVPTKQSAEGSHHSPSVISVIPEQILQFPEIGRAAWHGDTATWAAAARGRILGESCRLHCAGHSSALHRRRIITITITWSCHHFVSLHEDYG